jgi:nucleotide-binding universal stress UspA family protein
MKETLRKENYPMNQWFSLTCDRYGHLMTAVGGSSSKINRSGECPNPEQIPPAPSTERKLEKPTPPESSLQTVVAKPPIQRILVPIDATHVKPADLDPILKVARRFDAEITLLHCYSTPPSFDYAVGTSALADVTLHRNRIMAQLVKLCSDVQKSFAKCRCIFTFESLTVAIRRASERLQADLIAVPFSLDYASHCWTTGDLLDELIRRADCPVLGFPRLKASSCSPLRRKSNPRFKLHKEW